MMDTSWVMSEQVLAWARRLEAQRAHTIMLNNLMQTKNLMQQVHRKLGPKEKQTTPEKLKYSPPSKQNYKYCDIQPPTLSISSL